MPTGGKQHRVAVHKWWGTVSKVLEGIKNVTDWDDLPYQLFDMLAGLAAYLAVGQITDPIKHVGGKGRTAPGPGEISDIRWAVTYVSAAREGLVRGLKPPDARAVVCTNFAASKLFVSGAEHTSRFRNQKRRLRRISGAVW